MVVVMWPWITEFGVVVFCGLAVFVYFVDRAIAAFAPVFIWERGEDKDDK